MLKLNGKPLELDGPSPMIRAIHAFLVKAPKDEVFDCNGLGEKVSCSADFLRESRCHGTKLLDGFSANVRNRRFYGNPAAIKELLKRVGQ